MLSPKMEDYLKTIYLLQRDQGSPVATSAIAETMDVTPPTVTSMLESLAERGLIDREKYQGVHLSPEGETVALEVLRHHRLLETYLTERLGFDWTRVHDEAETLEHHISEEFETRVAEDLGHPTVDPHGDPIPDDSLAPLEDATGQTLADCREGDRVEVRRVRDRDPTELAYLDDAGLRPETTLEIVEVAPIGIVTVALDGADEEISVPDAVAEAITVESITQPAEATCDV